MARKNSNNKFASTAPAIELNQQSIEYLGVGKQPFANEILTEESFFNHQALTKISDSLSHQVQFSDLLLLVEGISGAGKTSLFRQFIQTEIANTKILAIQAEATDTLVQIQQKMSMHLQDLGDANHLDDNLKSLQTFDQMPLVVINNSHVLSDTTLQELLRYQQELKQEHDVNLKILLFANTGMRETLQKITDIQTDQMYVQHLPEFSPKQASAFIMHRLRCAGYFGEVLLDDEAITQLYKTCNGTPLDIMVQCAPLIDKAIAGILKPNTGLLKKAIFASVILSVLLGAGYAAFVYFDSHKTEPGLADDNFAPETEISDNETANIKDSTDVIDILESETLTTEPELESESNNMHLAQDNVVTQASQPENIDTVKTDENIINEAIDESKIKPEITTDTTSENEPKQELAIETAPTIRPQADNNKNETETEIPVEPSPKPSPELNPTLLKLKEMGLQDASWLLQQNSQNWTMQLLGAREPVTLLKFAQANHLSANAAWYKTWLSSRPYYVMVYGSYGSRDIARESINRLPPKLRSLKPWVKSMKSVQQALK